MATVTGCSVSGRRDVMPGGQESPRQRHRTPGRSDAALANNRLWMGGDGALASLVTQVKSFSTAEVDRLDGIITVNITIRPGSGPISRMFVRDGCSLYV